MSKDDFFVGWSNEPPRADRRFFLGAGLALLGTAAGGAALLASNQNAVGPGTWNMGDIRTFTGIATAEPYAMLRTTDIDGAPKTVLLACMGKCGVSARIRSHTGKPVAVRGSLIQRGKHAMIAVVVYRLDHACRDYLTGEPRISSHAIARADWPDGRNSGQQMLVRRHASGGREDSQGLRRALYSGRIASSLFRQGQSGQTIANDYDRCKRCAWPRLTPIRRRSGASRRRRLSMG